MANYIIKKSYQSHSKYYVLALIAVLLALFVVMLGAYTRLGDAGLGCPDWPGCYGKMVLPQSKQALQQAQHTFPDQPIVAKKAWKEMVHRYFAGTLGILIICLAVWATIRRFGSKQQPLLVPWLLVLLLIFQAVLGMWTVTLKLLPLVVMGHLLGGMLIAALLWWLVLVTKPKTYLSSYYYSLHSLRPWVVFGVIIVFLQIFLGAWTSTNYAALACPDFPYCNGSLFPNMNWSQAFNFMSPVGPNYEGGQLAMAARVTIQMAHRYGALLITIYLVPLALCLVLAKEFVPLRKLGWAILILLAAQITLGILNVVLILPVWTAVPHNGVGALLLLTMVTLLHKVYAAERGI